MSMGYRAHNTIANKSPTMRVSKRVNQGASESIMNRKSN